MNNFEECCFAFLADMLTNRPKDLEGKTIIYDNEDRKKYLDIIKAQKIEIEQNKTITQENRELLKRLNELLVEILTRKLI